jgi:hypothetical protein
MTPAWDRDREMDMCLPLPFWWTVEVESMMRTEAQFSGEAEAPEAVGIGGKGSRKDKMEEVRL